MPRTVAATSTRFYMPVSDSCHVSHVPPARQILFAAALILTLHAPQLAPMCLGSAVCPRPPIHGHDGPEEPPVQRDTAAQRAVAAFVTGSVMAR
jgi:hypothetical protein